jgi:hypothetical protein
MPNFKEQPTSENRERFAKSEETLAEKRKQFKEAIRSKSGDSKEELDRNFDEMYGSLDELKAAEEQLVDYKKQDEEEAIKINKDLSDAVASKDAAKLAIVRAKIDGIGREKNLSFEAEEEKEGRSVEERLGSLNQLFEKIPELKPKEDDAERYDKYLKKIEAENDAYDIVSLYNQIRGTFEYVQRVAKNPEFAEEMRRFFIDHLRSKGFTKSADAFEKLRLLDIKDSPMSAEREMEKVKLGYIANNIADLPSAISEHYRKTYLGCMDEKYLEPWNRMELGLSE